MINSAIHQEVAAMVESWQRHVNPGWPTEEHFGRIVNLAKQDRFTVLQVLLSALRPVGEFGHPAGDELIDALRRIAGETSPKPDRFRPHSFKTKQAQWIEWGRSRGLI